MRVFAELNEPGDRIHVHFRYDTETKDAVKRIPGARFVPKEKGGPLWQLPLDLVSARRLREEFGGDLDLGIALKDWGRQAVAKERTLQSLASVDDVPLKELKIKKKLPKLAKWLRPYQRADIKFLATTNALNLLEPRLGKTPETIGAIYEADLENGPHLVVGQQTSLDLIWRYEYERWTDLPVYTLSGEVNSTQRAIDLGQMLDHLKHGRGFVLATTADMIRRGLPEPLGTIEWNSITIDEYHKTGLAEIKNVFPKTINKFKAKRKYALSGTPMGGKPIKLWGGLHWLEPQQYTSKWRWAAQWLDIIEEWVGRTVHKKIGGIKPGREDAFYEALSVHAIRRLRSEVLPELPEKQWVDVWCPMTKKQAKQYRSFADDAEVRIDEYHLSATSVLAEYTRLKQFANSYCEVEFLGVDDETGEIKLKLKATPESGKLPYLMERLAEAGIDPDDPAGNAQAIVASQFKETADMVFDYLGEKGIKCAKITGDVTKKGARQKAALAFRADGSNEENMRVLVMTTGAGGVALTMDKVESVHVLDETWNPDDQEQLTDRALNTTDLHQVTAFIYRSNDSIEEYIEEIAIDKAITNKNVLDIRRQMLRKKEAA